MNINVSGDVKDLSLVYVTLNATITVEIFLNIEYKNRELVVNKDFNPCQFIQKRKKVID